MEAGTSSVIGIAAAGGLHVAFSLALFGWGRWVAGRLATKEWQAASFMPLAALGLCVLGICGTSVAIVRAFSAVTYAPAAERSALLSDSIASAMSITAVAGGLAAMLYVASIVAFAVGTRRARSR